eukprot:9376657-Lingulodinium_polyedra.AAC.1
MARGRGSWVVRAQLQPSDCNRQRHWYVVQEGSNSASLANSSGWCGMCKPCVTLHELIAWEVNCRPPQSAASAAAPMPSKLALVRSSRAATIFWTTLVTAAGSFPASVVRLAKMEVPGRAPARTSLAITHAASCVFVPATLTIASTQSSESSTSQHSSERKSAPRKTSK